MSRPIEAGRPCLPFSAPIAKNVMSIEPHDGAGKVPRATYSPFSNVMGTRKEWMSAPDESTTSACTTFSEGAYPEGNFTSIGVLARSVTLGTGTSANIARGGDTET
ncbi:MAG: hypothetical protein IPJ34_07760 [Myxococcales bacterium]|nr:hypothetical protein [Myxococcales bacterium]